MRTTLRGLRRVIFEILSDEEDDTRSSRKSGTSSLLGVKNKIVHVQAHSPLGGRIEKSLVDMISTSYEKIGGHEKIKNPGDLADEYPEWMTADIDDDPEPDILIAGKPSANGKIKLGVLATNGSLASKVYLTKMKSKLLRNGWWGEVSDAPAHIALNKLGIKPVVDKDTVQKLLGKEVVWHGKHPEGKFPGTNGWYSRKIGGNMHTKIIVGDV